MINYDTLYFDRDFITHKKHLFYLLGNEKEKNCGYIIASYSVKTDKIILKDCSNFIPSQQNLIDFVEMAKKKYKEECAELWEKVEE